jgi:SAM-dependent methyltransferase
MGLSQEQEYATNRINHWNKIAISKSTSFFSKAYHQRLIEIFRFLIPKGYKVLELGCGKGHLLASLDPSVGIGVDFSAEMIAQAVKSYPNLKFYQADVHDLSCLQGEQFDYIIMSDLINDIWNLQKTFEQIQPFCKGSTRLLLNFYSRLWQLPLSLAQFLGFAKPMLEQNWVTREDLSNLLGLEEFETIRTWQEVLFPIPIPVLSDLFNRFLVKIWPINLLALSNFMVARFSDRTESSDSKGYSVSVVIPARNEAGNIPQIFSRVPQIGSGIELVFVEGNSKDDTFSTIEREIGLYPQLNVKLLKQEGIGKGDAVRKGFGYSTGDILMILDADLTVPPEDLPRFYNAIASNKGEFINGVRLVYPMQKEAMRFVNFVGNKFFSLAFTWLLGQSLKDSLCGTKVLWREDYKSIEANRSYFGDFDPFGDFDLIFGAAKLNRKIVDLPIRYGERTYGTTNISRWKHGWLLLRMVIFAAQRLKFI